FSPTLSAPPPLPTLFPYTTLFRSGREGVPWPASLRRPEPSPPTRPRRAPPPSDGLDRRGPAARRAFPGEGRPGCRAPPPIRSRRSEEHTSELQSRFDIVCRLLLEK